MEFLIFSLKPSSDGATSGFGRFWRFRLRKGNLLGLVFALLFSPGLFAEDVFLPVDDFLKLAFPGESVKPSRYWLTDADRDVAEEVLQHKYRGMRARYWRNEGRTAWVLDEIGKERPITVGVVIENNKVVMMRILTFRESRGWEVRYPFFTDQFFEVELHNRYETSKHIDNISGATLSVRAVKRAVVWALYVHGQIVNADSLAKI